MNSVKEIVEWAASELSDWEADIVRRLLLNKTLPSQDLKEILITYSLPTALPKTMKRRIAALRR